jgi:ubiquinone/menaquinone biosynthesis C-methylase UbiE
VIDRIFYDADRAVKDVTLEMLEPDKKAVVLDCGPGNCVFTEEIQRRLGVRGFIVVDYNPNRLTLARSRGWLTEYGDINSKIPFADEVFDVIHAGQIIEHLNDTDRFVEELYRVTTPGGYCLISTPNLASWHNVLQLILGRQPHVAMVSDKIIRWHLDDDEVDEPKHRRVFTGQGLAMLLSYHGFTVEEIRGAGYYPFTGRLARLLSRIDRWHAAYVVVKARRPR